MPDFTISLTGAQATRVSQAFSFLNATPADPDGSPASASQVQQWIKRQVRVQVAQYELQQARAAADEQVDTTLSTEGWEG